jgi:6-phosphogluconolactonase (cycloisomerase 2 family)
MAFDPLGKFAYILGISQISIYQFNSNTGGFTFIGSKEPGAMNLSNVAIDPAGKHAYVSGRTETNGKVWVFNVNTLTGEIEYTENIDTGFASKPEKILIDPRGNFLYQLEYNFNLIRVYRIDQTTGSLTLIQTQSIKNPYGSASSDAFAQIVIDPAGRLLYAVAQGFSTPGYINVFLIDPATGTLSLSNTIADRPHQESLAVDPAGKFVSLTSASGSLVGMPNYISIFSVDPTAGSLNLVASLETGTTGNLSSLIVGIK